MSRNIFRGDRVRQAKIIFAKECEGWTDRNFEQAELMVMGLQYRTVAASDANIPLKVKISGALDKAPYIYRINEAARKREIVRVMNLYYHGITEQVINTFITFVNRTSNEEIREMKKTVRKRGQAQSKQLSERSKAI